MPATTAVLAMAEIDDVTDGVLVREHLGGDPDAFAVLHRRYFARLVAFCQGRGSAGADAEDIAQETLLSALCAAGRYQCDRPMWPWLRTIATRLLVDRADRARIVVIDLTDDPAALAEANPSPSLLDDDDLRAVDERAALAEAMSHLNRRHQMALQLRYLEDWSAEATAEFLGISPNAVDQLVHRARSRLRAELAKLGNVRAALLPVFGLGQLRHATRRLRERAVRLWARVSTVEVSATAGLSSMEFVALSAVALLATPGFWSPTSAGPGPSELETIPAVRLMSAWPADTDPSTPSGSQFRPHAASTRASGSQRPGLAPAAIATTDALSGEAPAQASADATADEEGATLRTHVGSRLGQYDNDAFWYVDAPCVGVTVGTVCAVLAEANDRIPPDEAIAESTASNIGPAD